MATKKFKKLPKDSQRAAFAQMDEDGTRERGNGKGGGVASKTLKPSKAKLPHIKTGDQQAMLDKSLFQYGKADKENKSLLNKLFIIPCKCSDIFEFIMPNENDKK